MRKLQIYDQKTNLFILREYLNHGDEIKFDVKNDRIICDDYEIWQFSKGEMSEHIEKCRPLKFSLVNAFVYYCNKLLSLQEKLN